MSAYPFAHYPRVTREEAKGDVGPGWSGIVDRLFDYCEPHGVHVLQVKEKFGGLRFYVAGEGISHAVWTALLEQMEGLADHTCEWCGAPGRRRDRSDGFSWLKTLCDDHAAQWQTGARWTGQEQCW